FAGTSGVLDDMPVDQLRDFEKDLYKYVETANPGLLNTIMEKKILDDNLKAEMSKVIKEAKQQFIDEGKEQRNRGERSREIRFVGNDARHCFRGTCSNCSGGEEQRCSRVLAAASV